MQENFHQPFADLNEETALRTILEGTATETGERFFKAPVEKLAKALRILTSRRHRDSCTSFFNPGSFERIYWLGHDEYAPNSREAGWQAQDLAHNFRKIP